MKVLHIISSGGLYGAEAVILQLSQTLANEGDKSEIALFENLPNPNLELEGAAGERGIRTYRVPCQGQLDLSVPGQIRDLARSAGADVVHSHGYKADLYTWAGLRKTGVPLVSTCHTWYDNSMILRVYGAANRSVLRSFAAVVAVSAEVKARLLAAGVRPERISTIPNGIDADRFPVDQARPEAQTAGPLTIGLVGRLSREKGVDLFLQAAARVLQTYPRTRFQIIGEGPDRPALQELLRSLSLTEQVELPGRRNDMPAVYAGLDILVSASRQEGLPITLLEGMASGRAIVATAVGEVPSLIHDRETGLLVPAHDVDALARGMEMLLRDATLRHQLGMAARARVEAEFSARAMTERYRQIYRSVLEASTRVRR